MGHGFYLRADPLEKLPYMGILFVILETLSYQNHYLKIGSNREKC
jgi:hypothetical protein